MFVFCVGHEFGNMLLPQLPALITQHRLNVPASPDHMENDYVFAVGAIDNNVVPRGQASQTGPQIVIAAAAYMWVTSHQIKPLSYGIDLTVGNLEAAALPGHV